jgi:hypothetical protein
MVKPALYSDGDDGEDIWSLLFTRKKRVKIFGLCYLPGRREF